MIWLSEKFIKYYCMCYVASGKAAQLHQSSPQWLVLVECLSSVVLWPTPAVCGHPEARAEQEGFRGRVVGKGHYC